MTNRDGAGGTGKRDPAAIGDVLDVVLGRFVGPDHAAQRTLFDRWAVVSGNRWNGTRPLRIDGKKVLLVEIPAGAAASRLRFDIPSLLSRIDAEVGGGVVESVRFKVANNHA